MTPTGIEPTTL